MNLHRLWALLLVLEPWTYRQTPTVLHHHTPTGHLHSRFNTFRYASFDVLWAYFSSQTNSKRHRPHPVMERSLRSKSSTKACHWHSSIVLGAMSRGSRKFEPFGWIWKFWKEFWKKTQFLQDSLHFTTLVALLQGSNANNRYHPLPVQICPGIRTQSDPIVPNWA